MGSREALVGEAGDGPGGCGATAGSGWWRNKRDVGASWELARLVGRMLRWGWSGRVSRWVEGEAGGSRGLCFFGVGDDVVSTARRLVKAARAPYDARPR